MRQGVAYKLKYLSAAMIVMPPFAMWAAWVITVVHVGLPSGLAGVERGYRRRLAHVGKFRLIAWAAEGAVKQLHGDIALVPLRGGACTLIVDHFAVGKALEGMALVKRMGGVVGDGVRKYPA